MKKIREKKYSILSIVSKYSFVFVFAFVLVMPFAFTRVEAVCGGVNEPPCNPTNNVAVKIDGIENPLPNTSTLPQFIEWFINLVLIVGIPLLVLAIIYAGFTYVKAQGNPGELEVAHRTLLYTVIGGALLLGAFVIANAIGKTVDDIKSTT